MNETGFTGTDEKWEVHVLKEIERRGSKFRIPVKECRTINQSHQLHTEVWKKLHSLRNYAKKQKRGSDDVKSQFENFRQKYHPFLKCVGPVGENPIHTCVLHGLVDLAIQIIGDFPELAKSAYKSDLVPWKNHLETNDDPGLYTGETVLHLAIGLGEEVLVDYLISNKADYGEGGRAVFSATVDTCQVPLEHSEYIQEHRSLQ